jgi:osmotically-inducible protein OsmY
MMTIQGKKGRLNNEELGLGSDLDSGAVVRADKVADAAKQQLRAHTHLSMQRIWCEFEEGRLLLQGQVPSFYLKQLAQTAVAKLDGVCQVVNEIEVVW